MKSLTRFRYSNPSIQIGCRGLSPCSVLAPKPVSIRYQSSVALAESSQESIFKSHSISHPVYKLQSSSLSPRPFTRLLSSSSCRMQDTTSHLNKSKNASTVSDSSYTSESTSVDSSNAQRADASLTQQALALLKKQNTFYAILEIRMRPYFVSLNDVIVTQKMKDAKPGDVLVFDRVREIGSQDFILKGNPYVDPSYFRIKAVVLEHPVSDDIVVEKKRRRGRNRTITNRNHHTALRVSHISIHHE